MPFPRIRAEAAVIAAGTLFWLALSAFVGPPTRPRPPQAEATRTEPTEQSGPVRAHRLGPDLR